MKTIYKYDFDINDITEIPLPIAARFLSWQYNHATDCCAAWFEVDRSADKEPRRFYIFGTGHDMPDRELHYLGTAIDRDGFVWHLYEEKQNDKRP